MTDYPNASKEIAQGIMLPCCQDIVTNLLMEVNARKCVWIKLSSARELKAIKQALKALNIADCVYGESDDKLDGYAIGITIGSVTNRTSKWLDDMMSHVDELTQNFISSDDGYGTLGDRIGDYFHRELKLAIRQFWKIR